MVSPQGFDKTLLSEFLPVAVERFGHTIGIEYERVSWEETLFADVAMPLIEESQDRAGGVETLEVIIAPEEKGGEVAAIRVPQQLCVVVVFAKEESSVSVVARVLVEEPIHGSQEALRLTQSERRERAAPVRCALVVHVRLQIGHQESGGGPFS